MGEAVRFTYDSSDLEVLVASGNFHQLQNGRNPRTFGRFGRFGRFGLVTRSERTKRGLFCLP